MATGENGTQGKVFLGIHILDENEEILAWDYAREAVKEDFKCLKIICQAPDALGSYFIEFDMVAEHITWFEDLGSSTLILELEVA